MNERITILNEVLDDGALEDCEVVCMLERIEKLFAFSGRVLVNFGDV